MTFGNPIGGRSLCASVSSSVSSPGRPFLYAEPALCLQLCMGALPEVVGNPKGSSPHKELGFSTSGLEGEFIVRGYVGSKALAFNSQNFSAKEY